MQCPRDRTPLQSSVQQTIYDRVEVDVCPTCHGIWFDQGELAAILQLENVDAFAGDSPLLSGDRPSLPCPRNPHVAMHERQLSVPSPNAPRPLKLDQCSECDGIWLDGDELKDMVARLRESNVRPFLENPETARMTGAGLWLFMFFTGLPIEQWNPPGPPPHRHAAPGGALRRGVRLAAER
jgi:Zn-finger nucleic acid-binding protein